VFLPHGTGQDKKVAVFTSSASDIAAAEAAGASLVGGEELVAKVAEEKAITADAVVATPDMVPKLGKIARILGPRCVSGFFCTLSFTKLCLLL
jgi:large subunit ribosomal protein L1